MLGVGEIGICNEILLQPVLQNPPSGTHPGARDNKEDVVKILDPDA